MMAGRIVYNLPCSTGDSIDSYVKCSEMFDYGQLRILPYPTLPNLTGKRSYGLLHLTWQGPGKYSYVEVAENLIYWL